jgi:Protein of unknown function (DUF2795)
MIERGSDKHGPRMDDQLGHEVEPVIRGDGPSRAEEWHDPDPVGSDEGVRTGGTPPGMTEDAVRRRAELAAWLGREAFPADAPALRAYLATRAAPDDLVDLLADLPEDHTYEAIGEVWAALHLPREDHRF